MKSRAWTTSELDIVRDRYPTGGYQSVQLALPHRSASAIFSKAMALGVRSTATVAANSQTDAWSASEDAKLREAYACGGATAAREALPHRSNAAVWCRITKLGFAKADGRRHFVCAECAGKPKEASRLAQITPPPSSHSGRLDRGDRALIEKRMPHVVAALARELGRSPADVVEALANMAPGRFGMRDATRGAA